MRDIRESQFELLRIVAIFFVILHHLIVKGADTAGYITDYNIHNHGILGIVLNSVVVGGVNLFVLISGWFGIKRIARSIVRLLVDCVIFGLISYLVLVVYSNNNFNIVECIKSCCFNYNWFVVSYMMLLIVSPIIEKTLETDYSQLLKWILLLTIFNLFFGYVLGRINSNGYNAVHFIYLYYIGRLLKFGGEKKKMRIFIQRYGLLVFFLFVIINALLVCGVSYYAGPINTRRLFAYNNPLVLVSSIALFSWFSLLKFKSRIINLLATGVFGIYILHTTKYVIPWRNAVANDIFVNNGYLGLMAMGGAIFVFCVLISIAVTPLTSSLTDYIYKFGTNCWNCCFTFFKKKR